MDIHQDESCGEPTVIEVLEVPDEENEEDIISGAGVLLPIQIEGPSHQRLRQIVSASPELPKYSSPPSSSTRTNIQHSPSVQEMERMLGINSDSPGAMDLFDTTAASSSGVSRKLPKKSARRTTMLSSEITDTLTDIRNLAASNTDRRRSSRLDARTMYYGSPSDLAKKENSQEQFKHPLSVKENWKIGPGRQLVHNTNVLVILNTANTAMLTKLPAVGPKSAFILQQYRDLHDGIKTIDELRNIPGLAKNFFDKFCLRNQIKVDDENETQE
jgi:DNA uptake protein ComE-like DNA-binding protein